MKTGRGLVLRAVRQDPRSWDPSVKAAAARVATLPLTAVCGFAVARILFGVDPDAYALFALLTSIPLLLPFLDFGMGASLVLAASSRDYEAERVRSVFLTCVRWLWLVGSLITGLGLVLTLTHSWPALLGGLADQPGTGWAMLACLALLGLFLPFNLGARLLVAQGRMHVTLILQAAAALATLILILGLSQLHVALAAYSIAFYASLAASSGCALALGVRAAPAGALRRPLFRDLFALRRWPMTSVVATSAAMFVQLFAAAVGLHADRLILSHRLGAHAVAVYFMAAQVFLALMSVVSSAGVPLWPRYNATPEVARPFRDAARLSVAGAGLSMVGVVVTPLICGYVTGDPGYVPWQVYVGWVLLLTVTGAVYPLGMFTSNQEGLIRQVPFHVGYLLMNVGLTFALIPSLGVAGPVIASALSAFAMQVLPFAILARRRMAELRSINQGAEAFPGPETSSPAYPQ